MNRTWKENFSAKMKLKIKKHKILRYPMMIWLFVVSFFYDIGHYLSSNSKRLTSILAVAIFFITGSSFSFAGQTQYEQEQKDDKWAQIQVNYEYMPTVLNDEDDELPSDDDLMDGYTDNEEIEQFSLDDIDDILDVNTDENTDDNTDDDEDADDEDLSSLSKDDWQLILVNKQHPIPDGYSFTSGVIKGTMKCDVRILSDLLEMMADAKDDGINLVVSSSYRDYDRQVYVFNRKIDYYMQKGYSYLDAYKLASITVTIPDASEHQIGLALDITCTTYSSLDIAFGDTKAGKWLAQHCAEYGFILRYPLGKEDITGIQFEPWHFRYVGKTAAKAIMEQGITLEEFVAELD